MQVIRNKKIEKRCFGPAAIAFAVAAHTCNALVMCVCMLAPPVMTLAFPSWGEFMRLLPLSLIVALVCMMQTAAVVQSFPAAPGRQESASRDFAAVGVGSILAALFGAFAVNSSPPRTAIVAESLPGSITRLHAS